MPFKSDIRCAGLLVMPITCMPITILFTGYLLYPFIGAFCLITLLLIKFGLFQHTQYKTYFAVDFVKLTLETLPEEKMDHTNKHRRCPLPAHFLRLVFPHLYLNFVTFLPIKPFFARSKKSYTSGHSYLSLLAS